MLWRFPYLKPFIHSITIALSLQDRIEVKSYLDCHKALINLKKIDNSMHSCLRHPKHLLTNPIIPSIAMHLNFTL